MYRLFLRPTIISWPVTERFLSQETDYLVKNNGVRLYDIYHGNVSDVYGSRKSPDLIISDGAYGVRGFKGDTCDTGGLTE